MIEKIEILALKPREKGAAPLLNAFEKAGMRVVSTSDRESAFRHLREHRPEAVIIDSTQDAIDEGCRLCEAVRQDPFLADTPIVFFVCNAVSGERAKIIRAGADQISQSPHDSEELFAWIEKLCERARRAKYDAATGLYRADYITRVVSALSGGKEPEWTLLLVKALNLKAYNICHGYQRGDALIADLAAAVRREVKKNGGDWDLTGRLDDTAMAVISRTKRGKSIAQRIVNGSVSVLKKYFTPYEWSKGVVEIDESSIDSKRARAEEYDLVRLVAGGVQVPTKTTFHPNFILDHAREVLETVIQEDLDYLIEPL